jgi:alkaline phosphatase D
VSSHKLLRLSLLVTVIATAAPAPASAEPAAFPYGVTTGEVRSTAAMFWTRAQNSGLVRLKVSRSLAAVGCSAPAPRPGSSTTVLRRVALASPSADNTVRVAISTLRPDTRSFYRFCAGSQSSRLGAVETAPFATETDPVRFALSGDADGAINPATGRPAYNNFEAYGQMASANNDFNVNLGDVMYSDSAVAGVPPALSLTDKWAKYRQNYSYRHLLNLRSKTGLFNMWDDHEFVDNFNRPQFGEELFEAGKKAFLDYNPVRFKSSTGLYSRVRWGRNLEVFFLDERAFRSAPASQDPACTNSVTGAPDPLPTLPQRLREQLGPQVGLPPQAVAIVSDACKAVINDPSRSILGQTQMQIFRNAIKRSTATFKVVVNAVPIQQTFFDPFDRWEGYNADRVGLLNFLRTNVRNVVFLTTDFHANMINNVRLGTFPEEGSTIDTGFIDFVTGPVALKTFAVDTDLKTKTPGASEAIRQFLKAPRPLGLGMRCAALNAYSYMQVQVTSQALTVALRDDQGRPVKETPSGPSCSSVTIARR